MKITLDFTNYMSYIKVLNKGNKHEL
jgi:hypothetical protein